MFTVKRWWVEIQANGTPFTPSKKPVQSDVRPKGYYRGAFHCEDCADICVNFGKTKQQATEFNHGTDDERFGVFLSM